MPNVSDRFAEYSYDAVGNRTPQTNGNGTSTEYVFNSDPRYRVTSITHKRGANVLAQIGYPSRDKVGNPESMTDWTGTWSYDYDSNNRLVDAMPPNPVPGQPAGGPYECDWVGNRLRPPYGTGNEMVYNEADQLIRWPGMYRYSYDNAGNLTQVKNDSETQVVKSYAYDAYGSLLSHDRFDGSVNQPYQYVGQLGYYTHWMEPDFELLLLGVRFYDPEVGRFGQRDPITNHRESDFSYAGCHITTAVDPDGKFLQFVVGGIFLVYEASCMKRAFETGDLYRGRNNVLRHESHFMAHCMAACLGTRCMPDCGIIPIREQQGLLTMFVGALMELFQTTPWGKPSGGGWGNNYWLENTKWNLDGVNCGLSGKNSTFQPTCFSCCYNKARKSGLL